MSIPLDRPNPWSFPGFKSVANIRVLRSINGMEVQPCRPEMPQHYNRKPFTTYSVYHNGDLKQCVCGCHFCTACVLSYRIGPRLLTEVTECPYCGKRYGWCNGKF